MPCTPPVECVTFLAIQNVDVDALSSLSEAAIRPILPCLVRMSLCAPLDTSDRWTVMRKTILKCLSGIDVVNSLVGLLSIDFQALEQDSRKEQQLRTKMGNTQKDSVLISQLDQSVALEFERSDAARKLRLLLSELLFVMSQIKEPQTEFYEKSSELFEREVYLEEVSDTLCIAQAELPSLLPITEVVEALLHLPNGIWLICRLVSNVPDSFEEVCQHLVANGEKQDEESVGGQRRCQALQRLCDMNPYYALNIRALCVDHCRMPGLAVALTLQHGQHGQSDHGDGISDVISFVSGLLLSSDPNVRGWFSQFIRNGQKMKSDKSLLQMLREELLVELQEVLPHTALQITEAQSVQGCSFIRLYCSLKGIAALKFSDEEINCLLRLVICRPPATGAGVRFVSLALCMLLACPHLLANSELERMAIEWIRWLTKEVGRFEKVSQVNGSFGEMLLLIAIHFHSNQTHAIADLVSTTLGMKSAVKANSLTRMKMIFTKDIFTEQVVASHAVKVAVTRGLNANMMGFLPIHCIYQLLRSRAFSKHKVPIKEWIYQQICRSTTPLHPLLPPLIQVYINSIILPSNQTDRTNEPITEQEILAVFRHSVFNKCDAAVAMETDDDGGGKSEFTNQLLLLYYILLYQDTLINNMKTIVAGKRDVHSYSPQLMSQIPMKYLLHEAQKEQQQYAGIFAPILKLLVTHYPQLCLVEDWLDEELTVPMRVMPAVAKVANLHCNVEAFSRALTNVKKNPTPVLLLLDQLLASPASDILPFSEALLDNFITLLQPGIYCKLLDLVKAIWVKLNTVMPRKLRVMTVNALRVRREGAPKVMAYTEDDITVDPLIVLRCDDRVFRCPPMLEIMLRVLEAFLQASKTFLSKHIQATPGETNTTANVKGANIQEREELKMALVSAQESAAVQVLLECCLSNKEEQNGGEVLGNLREVQCLICSHLHQKFIADPNLVKLVHFQGYPSELLAVTVAGIPSMHICLDFIPELLSQPHLDKQIFAVELVSYLSVQYALPKSLGVAKLAINVMSTLHGVLTSGSRVKFFVPTLPAAVRICRAFPPLCEDAISLLTQLGRVCTAHLSTTSNATPSSHDSTEGLPQRDAVQSNGQQDIDPSYGELLNLINKTFAQIAGSTALLRPLHPVES